MQVDSSLAYYAPIGKYLPTKGDFIINVRFRPWGLFIGDGLYQTRYGVVDGFEPNSMNVSVLFDGLPSLLFTMDESEYDSRRVKIPLGKMRNAAKGTWAVMKHDKQHNVPIWYV